MQTSQTGGQQDSDTSPFSIPWLLPRTNHRSILVQVCETNTSGQCKKAFFVVTYK
jgi:hypothetical protein